MHRVESYFAIFSKRHQQQIGCFTILPLMTYKVSTIVAAVIVSTMKTSDSYFVQ